MGATAACALFPLRLDWSLSDIANQVCLGWLVLSSFALGILSWNRSACLIAGLALPAALALWHVVVVLLGWSLPYPSSPGGVVGALSLLVLALPGVLMAFVGHGLTQGLHHK